VSQSHVILLLPIHLEGNGNITKAGHNIGGGDDDDDSSGGEGREEEEGKR
jgi:hypothetical protein